MVHFGSPRVGPINTPNIGPIDEGLIWISAMESHPWSQVKRIEEHDISCHGTTTKQLRPNRIFCCSAALLAKVYTIHTLLQRCFFSCGGWLLMPYNRMTLLPNSSCYMALIIIPRSRKSSAAAKYELYIPLPAEQRCSKKCVAALQADTFVYLSLYLYVYIIHFTIKQLCEMQPGGAPVNLQPATSKNHPIYNLATGFMSESFWVLTFGRSS